MIILGIDPGLATTGFGAIKIEKYKPLLIKCGVIKTNAGDHISKRLFQIHIDLLKVIKIIKPEIIAIENAYSLLRYPRAGIILGGVLGIIYLTVFQNNLKMIEITPREIKNSLAGYGAADKYQLRDAVKNILGMKTIKSLHSSDALATALTAYYRNSNRKRV
ncbi:MAG: crossover junction endodeoxyribonuclease RuvC [Nitrospirae bacterium]|jgi:crossover junction endodeoxyribonuclease RuvC|nr:crossover junction endodeoxyribonuclease RuvC [Nitrospirota bacterium]